MLRHDEETISSNNYLFPKDIGIDILLHARLFWLFSMAWTLRDFDEYNYYYNRYGEKVGDSIYYVRNWINKFKEIIISNGCPPWDARILNLKL